jgi:hypothetical protein
LRQFEGVLNQLALRLAFPWPQNFHDIESKCNVWIIEQAEPGEAAFGNAQLFLSIDSFDGAAKFFAAAGFDFDEHQRIAVAANDVDLAAATIFEIAIENLVVVAPQKSAGQFLAASAAAEMFRQ